MKRPATQKPADQPQNDPDETNDPRSSDRGDFAPHVYNLLSQVFERLGKMDQKIDQLSADHKDLKGSVEKHDRLIMRVTFSIAGVAITAAAIWFVYVNFLKDNLSIEWKSDNAEVVAKPKDGAAGGT